jgi:hypothetical protein
MGKIGGEKHTAEHAEAAEVVRKRAVESSPGAVADLVM